MAIDIEPTYRRYGPMVLRRCRSMLRDEEAAADAMQDVFVQLLRHQARIEDRGMSSFLYRVATNVCLNRIRATKRKPVDERDEALANLAALDSEVESRAGARSALARLFGRHEASTAMIAVLHHHDGLTLAEVAEVMGMSVSGVRKRLRKLKAGAADLDALDPCKRKVSIDGVSPKSPPAPPSRSEAHSKGGARAGL